MRCHIKEVIKNALYVQLQTDNDYLRQIHSA
jgi:hypothetical protein